MFSSHRLLLLLLFLFPAFSYGQDKDKMDSLALAFKAMAISDTLKTPADSLQMTGSALNSTYQNLEAQLDSIKNPPLAQLDSAKTSVKGKIDSLQVLQLPHEKYLRQLDSLQRIPMEAINERVAATEEKIKKGLKEVPGQLETKTGKIEGITGQLPAVNLPGSMGNADQPNLVLPVQDLDLPVGAEILPEGLGSAVSLPEDILKTPGGVDVPEIMDNVPDIPQEKMTDLKGLEGVSEKMEEVNGWADRGSEYKVEMDSLQAGNTKGLEQRVDEQAGKLKEVDEFKKETAEFDRLRGEQEKYKAQLEEKQRQLSKYADPEIVKQRIMEKSKRVANDQLALYKKKVIAAREKLSLTRYTRISRDSLTAKVTRRSHSQKGKLLRERLRPGFNLEIGRVGEQTSFDLAPLAGYKLNSQWSMYASYMYRFNWRNNDRNFDLNKHTYGPRWISTYDIYKGLTARVSYERIRTSVPRGTIHHETTRRWVPGAYAGIGKSYDFARYVKGNIQVMYNFLYSDDSPYQKKWNIRMGFEFDLQKKKKRRWDIPLPKDNK